MTTKTKNRFFDRAQEHITTIEATSENYRRAKLRDAESKAQFENAKAAVASILNDKDADFANCVERLVLADARVRLLEHRLSAGDYDNVSDTLLELAASVDEAEGFVSGASSYIARTVRSIKTKEIAAELDLPLGKVDTNEITIRLHPKARAAERLSMTRISQYMELGKVNEAMVLKHMEGVLVQLRNLAEFEFEDVKTN
jgi:hypothetical protein